MNIGNSQPTKLMDFVYAVEKAIGKKAKINYMPMQAGDVVSTWADSSSLQNLTGYKPDTNVEIGVTNFVDWYQDYLSIEKDH